MSLRPALLATSGVLALLLGGCSTPAAIVTPVQTTAAVEATPTSPAPTTTSASATPTGTASLGATVTPTTTATSPLAPGLVSAGAGSLVALTTDNAFHADGWAYGNYLPAGTTTPVPALAATVNCDADGMEMEYRFTPTYGSLRVSVAQDVLSDSSDNKVEFTIYADGKVVAQKAITFKQTAELTASLAGVTVVKLVASTKGTCRTSSTALVTKAVVRG